MESVLKNIYINKIQVPKIHGHVRLELRGCRETEVVEHDNHMTAAFEKMFSNNGYYLNIGSLEIGLHVFDQLVFNKNAKVI